MIINESFHANILEAVKLWIFEKLLTPLNVLYILKNSWMTELTDYPWTHLKGLVHS